MGSVKGYLNENALSIQEFPVKAEKIAGLINLIDADKVSNSVAAQQIFPQLIKNPESTAEEIARTQNLMQESDAGLLQELINEAINKYPDKVEAYRKGKTGLMGLFMGEVMKATKGKADPKLATQLLKEKLES